MRMWYTLQAFYHRSLYPPKLSVIYRQPHGLFEKIKFTRFISTPKVTFVQSLKKIGNKKFPDK